MDFNATKIFFKGSKTYFTSSLFFPKKIRNDVFTLYAFVRVADDFVDQAKQDPKKIKQFKKLYLDAKKGKKINNPVIVNFVKLAKSKNFDNAWIDAFLDAMIQDTKKTEYKTINETVDYMYGSAEVVGLMMNRILDIDPKADRYARMLGRSMQYANFLRDIDEDNMLGRQYIPTRLMKKYGLKNLYKQHALKNKSAFKKLMRSEIKRFETWQTEAEKGFAYIPQRNLIPIKTASDMYKWTMAEIKKDPMIVFEKKVKPSRCRILLSIFGNVLKPAFNYKMAPYVFLLNHITG